MARPSIRPRLLLVAGLSSFQTCVAQASAGEGNGQEDIHQINEGHKESRLRALRCDGGQAAHDGAEVAGPQGRKPALLAGGNPQVAKGYGDAPVQAYITAMPDWKHDVGQRLDALIARTVPGVRKAVKWNSPFYGVEDEGWFLSFHCFMRYVKVAFFRGASLRPVPPGSSKHKDVRYLDIYEDTPFDGAQLAAWVKQASQLPGERM